MFYRFFFFFSSRRRHTRCSRDWSSDVCSSDLNDLVVATFGRSFWILDDMTPLRQMDSHVAGADTWLFRPQTAIRMRSASDQGTPVPMDESLAANPPEGAVL